jgi:hypothetical protein
VAKYTFSQSGVEFSSGMKSNPEFANPAAIGIRQFDFIPERLPADFSPWVARAAAPSADPPSGDREWRFSSRCLRRDIL